MICRHQARRLPLGWLTLNQPSPVIDCLVLIGRSSFAPLGMESMDHTPACLFGSIVEYADFNPGC
jgi:hypothetical protein